MMRVARAVHILEEAGRHGKPKGFDVHSGNSDAPFPRFVAATISAHSECVDPLQ